MADSGGVYMYDGFYSIGYYPHFSLVRVYHVCDEDVFLCFPALYVSADCLYGGVSGRIVFAVDKGFTIVKQLKENTRFFLIRVFFDRAVHFKIKEANG